MSDVVNQRAGKQRSPGLPDALVFADFLQTIQRLPHEMENTEAMAQPRVFSAGKG